jgi:Zn-dependent M28 family amino/carboxypeptidase
VGKLAILTSLEDYPIAAKKVRAMVAKKGITQEILLVTAHYDSTNIDPETDVENPKYENNPGADDNASGVAGMLELGLHVGFELGYF